MVYSTNLDPETQHFMLIPNFNHDAVILRAVMLPRFRFVESSIRFLSARVDWFDGCDFDISFSEDLVSCAKLCLNFESELRVPTVSYELGIEWVVNLLDINAAFQNAFFPLMH